MDFLPDFPLHATPLVVFGLLLIFGALGGYVAHRVSWLPSITGFMAIGCLIGPSGLRLLTFETMAASRILVDIALALILYRLGLSLDVREIWSNPKLAVISATESAVTFCGVLLVLHLLGVSAVVAALIAAIAISSSPAVLLHVAHEVGAEGEVTESAKTLVALNNVLSFVAFSAILPLAHFSNGSGWTVIVAQPVYRLLGSLLLSVVFGFALHELVVKTKDAAQYRLAWVIGVTMMAIGLSWELKLSTLLVPLALGVTVSSLEREKLLSGIEFGSAFELFFIILFVYAGAGLHLRELVAYGPLILVLVVARSLAKIVSVGVVSTCFRQPFRNGIAGGLLLVPMAGMAIGLVQTVLQLFPQHGGTVSAIVLGSVTLFETVGPPVVKAAFRLCGEAADGGASDPAA